MTNPIPTTAANDRLTLSELPPHHAIHWVAARKAQVVQAVQAGLITLDEALVRYRLSIAEFVQWQHALHQKGVKGLRQSRTDIRRIGRGRRRKPMLAAV